MPEANAEKIAIVVVAAGQGLRAGEGLPKQYRLIGQKPLLTHTLDALRAAAPQARIVVVIHPSHTPLFEAAVQGHACHMVPGGATRQTSCLAGLESLVSIAPTIVLIHDAARPFVSPGLIARAGAAAEKFQAAIPGVPVIDTIKTVDGENNVTSTLFRPALRAVQTPQAFAYPAILMAHRKAAAQGIIDLGDDAAVAELAGIRVHMFDGDAANIKITLPEDFIRAQALMIPVLNDIRTGQGYDVHAFGPGDHVWLGGIKIAHDQGLIGYSDADVVLHAITDAILGAIGDGDIGAHFPPSDPAWKGAASAQFLEDAVARVFKLGGRISNIDATIVCETPKIGPHRDAIRNSIAAIARLDVSRVAVKATTSERLGFTGRREGMATLALATIRLPGN